MLIGSRVLPPEFFQAASNPFVVGVSVCECRGGGQRVAGGQANSVLVAPAILGVVLCEGLVGRGEASPDYQTYTRWRAGAAVREGELGLNAHLALAPLEVRMF